MAHGCVKASIIGCVIVLVIGIVAAVTLGFIAKGWVRNVLASKYSDFGKRISHLQSDYPFKEDPGNALTEDQVERFLGVCKTVEAYKKQHQAEFQQMDKELEKEDNPLVGAFKFYMKFGNGLRSALVNGLEQQHMSLQEYDYVHHTVLKTMGAMMQDQTKQSPEAENQIKEIEHQMEQNPQYKKWIQDVVSIPEENKKLLIKYKDDMQQYLPGAPFSITLFPLLSIEQEGS